MPPVCYVLEKHTCYAMLVIRQRSLYQHVAFWIVFICSHVFLTIYCHFVHVHGHCSLQKLQHVHCLHEQEDVHLLAHFSTLNGSIFVGSVSDLSTSCLKHVVLFLTLRSNSWNSVSTFCILFLTANKNAFAWLPSRPALPTSCQ